jgi:LuxR family maltose regulon positive regulatory protein
MKEILLNTKLHVPQYRRGMVQRSRCQKFLTEAKANRLLLISAPAGFGKTSLLSQWLADYRNATAWITLDKNDNDPARFIRYLAAGIQRTAPGTGNAVIDILNSPQAETPEIEPLLTLLMNDLSEVKNDIIIVLDDYHVIENINIHQGVSFLIENMPSQVHLVISTRSDPPMPIARWRARRQMTEIRGDDLRFSSEETRELIKMLTGHELSADEINILGTKTEGWAAGLQMAALSLQGKSDIAGYIKTFSGSNRYIMDYLVEEVLRGQSKEMEAFLLQTSILERLNSPLCEAVTRQPGGQKQLEKLENANMFLVPLDDRRRWYRYHRLFADLLSVRLQESQPELMKELHLRAARWFEDNDYLTEAITHALASGDHLHTAKLVEKAAIELITRGELSTLTGYHELIPKEITATRPVLCVYFSWTYIFSGRIRESQLLLDQAETILNRETPNEENSDLQGNIEVQQAFAADIQGDITGAIELLNKADQHLAKTNYLMRSVIPFIRARVYRLNGDMAKTNEQLREVARLARETGNIMTLATATYDLASTWKIEGKLRQAAALYEDTIQTATEMKARHFGTLAKIDAGMSDLRREWNDLETAGRDVQEAIAGMKSWRNPTDMVIANIMQSRIQQAQGDFNGAAASLEKAAQIRQKAMVFEPIGTMLETDRVKLWLNKGNTAAVNIWLEKLQTASNKPTLLRELEELARARVLLAQGKLLQALRILENIEQGAEAGGRKGRLIEILILKSLALKTQGENDKAISSLAKALYLAEPEGYIRSFIDEGKPMAELLYTFRQKQPTDPNEYHIGKDYLDKLLKAFPEAHKPGNIRLFEELSRREIEILRRMAEGKTNKQIAEELIISPGTVKAHTANIYRKLDAVNRTQAIALAREHKLLP